MQIRVQTYKGKDGHPKPGKSVSLLRYAYDPEKRRSKQIIIGTVDRWAGQSVDIEGPYGRFDLRRINRQAQQLWVAGGIGVTPFLAWLNALHSKADDAPSADLHYCTRNCVNDPFVPELTSLCASLPTIRLHIHGAQQGDTLDASTLLRNVAPENASEIWFCGPSGLADVLRQGIKTLRQTRLRFHQEAFEMR